MKWKSYCKELDLYYYIRLYYPRLRPTETIRKARLIVDLLNSREQRIRRIFMDMPTKWRRTDKSLKLFNVGSFFRFAVPILENFDKSPKLGIMLYVQDTPDKQFRRAIGVMIEMPITWNITLKKQQAAESSGASTSRIEEETTVVEMTEEEMEEEEIEEEKTNENNTKEEKMSNGEKSQHDKAIPQIPKQRNLQLIFG